MSQYSTIPTAAPIATPVVSWVEVEAPADLEEGYTFDAIYDGVTFKVTVPKGGATKGQRFQVPFTPPSLASETTPVVSGDNAPHGQWRDGLCDCCKFGCLHPHFLNAWCCPQILMGQVLTRMKMDWLGRPAPEYMWRKTFRRIFYIVVVYIFVNVLISPPSPTFDITDDGMVIQTSPPPETWQRITTNVVNMIFGLYTLIVLMKLRTAIRSKYEIPQTRCCGWEDLCCAFWCTCCTVAQLARQTVDYSDRRAVCCSETGLPRTAPVFIV